MTVLQHGPGARAAANDDLRPPSDAGAVIRGFFDILTLCEASLATAARKHKSRPNATPRAAGRSRPRNRRVAAAASAGSIA